MTKPNVSYAYSLGSNSRKIYRSNVEMIAMIFKYIWSKMNSFLFNQSFESPKQLLQKADRNVKDYQDAQKEIDSTLLMTNERTASTKH